MKNAIAAALLALAAACDYDPRGRCDSAGDCLAGQVCAGGVCAAPGAGPPNHAPSAAPDAYSVTAGGTLDVPAATGVLANDVDQDGDALEAERVSTAAHGLVFLSPDGSLHYVPQTGYTGDDAFTYRASDGALRSAETTVSLTVTP